MGGFVVAGKNVEREDQRSTENKGKLRVKRGVVGVAAGTSWGDWGA